MPLTFWFDGQGPFEASALGVVPTPEIPPTVDVKDAEGGRLAPTPYDQRFRLDFPLSEDANRAVIPRGPHGDVELVVSDGQRTARAVVICGKYDFVGIGTGELTCFLHGSRQGDQGDLQPVATWDMT